MPQSGPRKLNKILIFLGVLAFGLIVTDRVMEAFRAGDGPETAADSGSASPESVVASTNDGAADPAAAGLDADADAVKGTLEDMLSEDAEALVTLENLFGSPVVLVSATEPSYVVTEDERRFDVGGVIDDATTLAGVTSHQLIFEQAGDLLVISLPDPAVQ